MKSKTEIVEPEIIGEAETSSVTQGDKVTALTVRVDALVIPDGSPAEQANALHSSFLHSAVSAKIRAIQCGWVLAVQRERIGYGQWLNWIENNLDFAERTVRKYIDTYDSTVGAYRAQQRRPLPLSVEPTMEEITEATKVTKEKQMAALLRETGVVENNPNHGGEREGAGRKAAELPKLTKVQEAETVWAGLMAQLDKTVVMDTIPLLGAKAARVCHDRVAELARALKEHLKEF